MKTKQDILQSLEIARRGNAPAYRKRKNVMALAAQTRNRAKRDKRIVCWRCGVRRETTRFQADHLCPMQVVVDLGHPHYFAASCPDCNKIRQKEYPYSDQVARLKTDVVSLSHPQEKIFAFLSELSMTLFNSPRHASILIGWIPGYPLYTNSKGYRAEYTAANDKLKKAGLL